MPLQDLVELIRAQNSFMIAAHVGPDGDAIGSGLALRDGLRAVGKEAWMISSDGVPGSCRYLPDAESVLLVPPKVPDCALIIDCDGTPDRTAAPYIYVEKAKTRALIDHHRTAKPIFDANWLDSSQAATAMMIRELLRALNVELTPNIATYLLCGISTDTGHFRHDNTTPDVFRVAAECVEAGANPSQTAFKLFDEKSLAATELLGIGIARMKSEVGGQLVWSYLDDDAFRSIGAFDESSEGVINVLRNVRGARMALVIREARDETGVVARCSVRCVPSLRADLFCGQFGGGGHAAASGFRVRHKPFPEAVEMITKAAREWVQKPPSGVESSE